MRANGGMVQTCPLCFVLNSRRVGTTLTPGPLNPGTGDGLTMQCLPIPIGQVQAAVTRLKWVTLLHSPIRTMLHLLSVRTACALALCGLTKCSGLGTGIRKTTTRLLASGALGTWRCARTSAVLLACLAAPILAMCPKKP